MTTTIKSCYDDCDMDAPLATRIENILRFLEEKGAISSIRHGVDRNLRAHLYGVWKILASWHLPGPTCVAGLCHSIYGTESFQSKALQIELRPDVRSVIGTEAERLAYLFGEVRQRTLLSARNPSDVEWLDGESQDFTRADHDALLHVLAANTLDQFSGRGHFNRAVLSAIAPLWNSASSRLCVAAQRQLRESFQAARMSSTRRAILLFVYPFWSKWRTSGVRNV